MSDVTKGPETVDEIVERWACRAARANLLRGFAADLVELAAGKLTSEAAVREIARATPGDYSAPYAHTRATVAATVDRLRSLVSAPPEPSRSDTDGGDR